MVISSTNCFATPLMKVENKAIHILKSLPTYYSDTTVNLSSILRDRYGIKGSPAIKSVSCQNSKVTTPNGNKEDGFFCTLGIDSGLSIKFNSKLEPIKIDAFVP